MTQTVDSAGPARWITVGPWFTRGRAEIVLRHRSAECWCSAGGDWTVYRERAVRFATNLDALVYCQAMGMNGVVVAFDEFGGKLYELSVDRVLEVVSADPAIREIIAKWRQGEWGSLPNTLRNQ